MKSVLSKLTIFLELGLLQLITATPVFADDDVFGNITIPEPLKEAYGPFYGDLLYPGGGIIGFASNLIKLIMIVAGIWAFINIILAGFGYITNPDKPEELSKANDKIYKSLLGLAIIAGSFILAAIAGWILFGDASAILIPKIYGPGINGTPVG